jgi:hypothetical protein
MFNSGDQEWEDVEALAAYFDIVRGYVRIQDRILTYGGS